MLSTGDVARALGVTINTVKRWVRQDEIEAVMLPGGHYRIPRQELERLRSRPAPARLRALHRERERSWERAEAWRRAQPVEAAELERLLAWVDTMLETARAHGPIPEPSVAEKAERVRTLHEALAHVRG